MNAVKITVAILALAITAGCASGAAKSTPERVAEMRALEAESAARLAAEGAVLFAEDRAKQNGYEYCALAVSLLDQGELRRGIREASKALFLGEQTGDQCLLAFARRDLAVAYSYAGHLDKAQRFAEEALAGAGRCRDWSRVVGPASKVIGDVHLRQGRPTQAISLYEKTLASSSADFQPFGLVSLANAHLANGDSRRARQLLLEADANAGSLLKPLIQRGLGRVALAEGKHREAADLFERAVSGSTGSDAAYHRLWALDGLAQARLSMGDRSGAAAAYRQAFTAAEEARARFRSEEFKTGLFGDAQQIFDAAIGLLVEEGQSEAAFDASERSRARALQDLLRGRVIAKAGGEVFADPSGRSVSASELRAIVPEGVAVTQYHVSPLRTYAWVLRRTGLTVVSLDVRSEVLTDEVRRFREAIQRRGPDVPVLGGRLYERLIVPLGLNPAEAVVIVPHDALHHLPFQALRGPRGYFIEERRISYAPSASALRHLLEKASPERSHLLAFGNPDLGSAKLGLPGAEYEVQQIKALFRFAEVHVGRGATKERFLERAPEHHVLHVAAHAELDEIDPLYSIIHLASTERTPGDLEAHELYQLNLAKASLVALSACNSGLGKVSRGDEVWGFTRSLLAAGARSLVVSLWPVEDVSTARLMERFYQGLREGSVAENLRQSQLELLRDERFSHPFFWAPFNVVGDWR